MFVHSISTFLL